MALQKTLNGMRLTELSHVGEIISQVLISQI